MNDKKALLIFKFLFKQLEKDLMIFFDDYNTTKRNFTFSMTLNPHNNKPTSIRSNFNFKGIFIFLDKEIDNLYNNYKELSCLLKKKNLSGREIVSFFEIIFSMKQNLVKNIERISFLQKEINYILDSFPIDYPNVTLYRTKQELKSFIWLKDLFEKFANILTKALFQKEKELFKDDGASIVIGWSASDEDKFFDIFKEPLFLFNGSYTLLNRQSCWIIIFHEALHYLLNYFKKSEDEEIKQKGTKPQKRGFLARYGTIKIETMKILAAFVRNQQIRVDFNLIMGHYDDIFCDAFLTYLFGNAYFLPLFSFLAFSRISSDNDTNINNSLANDVNWLRLSVAAKFNKDNNFEYDIGRFLKEYNHMLLRTTPWRQSKQYLEADIKLLEMLQCNFEKILTKYLSEEIKIIKKSFQKDSLIMTYLQATRYVAKKFYDSLSEAVLIARLKEGRVITNALQASSNLSSTELKLSEDDFNKFYNLPVIHLSFLKVRFDGYKRASKTVFEKFIDKYNNDGASFLFFNVGPYTFLLFEFLKYNSNRKERLKEIVEKIKEQNLTDELDVQEDYLLYKKNEIAGPVIKVYLEDEQQEDEQQEDKKIKDFFEFANKNGLITIQIQIQSPLNSKKNSLNEYQEEICKMSKQFVKKIKGNNKKKFKYLIFTPSTWVDFILLLSTDHSDYNEILNKIKEILHKKEEEKIKFSLTFTDVSFNTNSQEIALPTPHMLGKFSSENKNTSKSYDYICDNTSEICGRMCGTHDFNAQLADEWVIESDILYEKFVNIATHQIENKPCFSDIQLRTSLMENCQQQK